MSDEMNDTHTHQVDKNAPRRFIIMIMGSITVVILIVCASMSLYFSSGTALLDLSRPGYQSVRDQIRHEDTFNAFPSSGTVDKKVLDSFKKEYDKRANDATSVDAFGGDVLSDDALSIDNAAQ